VPSTPNRCSQHQHWQRATRRLDRRTGLAPPPDLTAERRGLSPGRRPRVAGMRSPTRPRVRSRGCRCWPRSRRRSGSPARCTGRSDLAVRGQARAGRRGPRGRMRARPTARRGRPERPGNVDGSGAVARRGDVAVTGRSSHRQRSAIRTISRACRARTSSDASNAAPMACAPR
jgi:hypothetical protein